MNALHHTEMERLPACQLAGPMRRALENAPRLIITAPPGAGKSTVLPLMLLDTIPGKILMLEPRRIAARQVAERMAWLLGEPVGQTVGYRIRFESKVSKATRIEVLTEGILTRMLIDDPALDGVGAILFDEFHERSLASDEALALTRQAQALLREDLRMVLMSATIDTTALATALDAPVLESEGKLFPVEILRTSREADAFNVAELVAHTVREAHATREGDILAFLPGEAEIRRCAELLGSALGATHLCPLYGLLSNAEQKAAIAPSAPRERKVVLATPIAETSLTIEGVRVVVDGGLCKRLVVDPRSGLSHLETVRISLDMATQRSGRAGRVAPGVCYRLWSAATEARMPLIRTPEILEADLASLVLDAAAWGETDLLQLPWLTPPPAVRVHHARQLLESLGAVDASGRITPHGKRLAALPCHPRIAQMLLGTEAYPLGEVPLSGALPSVSSFAPRELEQAPFHSACRRFARTGSRSDAEGRGTTPNSAPRGTFARTGSQSDAEEKAPLPIGALAADIAAILEEKDPLSDVPEAGLDLRLQALRRARKAGNLGRWARIDRIARQYASLARASLDTGPFDPYHAGALLASAWPERVGKAFPEGGPGVFLLSGGEKVAVNAADPLAASEWLAVASMNTKAGGVGRVFLAAPVALEDLLPLARTRDIVSWDSREGAAVARRETRLGVLLLESKPLSEGVREAQVQAICEAAPKEGLSMFDFSDSVQNLQRRVASVAAWHPELALPDLSTEAVLACASEWLPAFIGKASTRDQLRKIDLSAVLWSLLSYEQQQAVDRLAPTHITVPTGSQIRLEYRQGADAPVLRVRLQECFGLLDTPMVDGGRLPVLMELLSPGYKPVQLTRDLRSFWQGTYFEVRKELRRRYPKHAWPEDPLAADPVRGVKRNPR